MPIPDFQAIMLPLLQFMSDGKEHSTEEINNAMAHRFGLTADEINELLASGKQPIFQNRVSWTRTYLTKALLLETPRRSTSKITERGKTILDEKPLKLDINFLKRFPEFLDFRERKSKAKAEPEPIKATSVETRTPEEVLEDAYQEIRDNLTQEILTNVKNCSPAFLERLVVELLVKMGYGGTRKEAARAVGQSGDGGIDGIIDEDRLGLDAVYIQAKRWEGIVGRPEIQKFVGALMGRKAKKGIFITTSAFSGDALSFVSAIDYKIVLIDGKRLAEFMLDYDIGVSVVTTYSLKRIDSDYFTS